MLDLATAGDGPEGPGSGYRPSRLSRGDLGGECENPPISGVPVLHPLGFAGEITGRRIGC